MKSYRRWILLAAALVLLGACEKKLVYVPAEWQTPPPAAENERPQQPAQTSPAGPVVKSQPSFHEKEISSPPAGTFQEAKPAAPLAVPYQGPRLGPQGPQTSAPQVQAKSQAASTAPAGEEAKAAASANPKAKAAGGPQYQASMHLVENAKTDMGHGNVDHAISLLEQAIQVDVNNGDAFFMLARGWHRKGSVNKSLGFARKAEVLFQGDKPKLKQVLLFEADLLREKGETDKSDAYRKKANKL
jgi:tetratricopeptide (TPR) repeat protein